MSVGTALKDLATQQLPEEKLAAEVATANRSIALHHSLLKDALKKIQAVHKDGQMYVEKGRQMATELARVADALGDGEGAQLTTQAERDGLRRLAALQSRVFDMLRDLNQVVHAAAAAPVEQTLLLSRGSRADVKRFEKLAATLEQCKRKQQQQAAASSTSRQQPLEAGEAVAGARNSLAEAGQQLSTLLGKVNGDMVAFGPRFFTAFYAAFARMLEEGRALAEAQAETNAEMLRAAGQKAPAGKAETAEQDADQQQQQQQQQQQATPGADADKRAEVLSQIIDAERRHVARLESIMKYRDHIVKELAEKRINLSQDELSAIFMNVDDVYAVHLATLPLLEQAFGAEPAVLSERVAAVVEQQMAATERAYMPFLEGTSLALGTLDRAMKHKSFSALIRLLAQQQGIFGKFTLEQLLALPARHIKKFDTLLKLFHENTPLSSKGWFVFHEMLEKFDAVVARLSRAKAQGDNMKKLIDVRDRIKDFEGDVAEVGRILLHDDSVSLAVHQPKPPVFGGQPPTPLQPGHGYYLFCFNDCLSLCTKLSSGLMSTGPDTYQHVARIPVTGMRVEELPESSDTIKNGFRVECTGGEFFVFGAHSASAKITWVSRLRLATAEWKKTQVYGTDPEELMKRESEQEHYIPQIVEDAIAYIEKNGTETEGIFRLSCSARLIASLQLKVNTGKSIEYTDPLVAAVMLKQWLGSLPNPLLLRHLYNDWLDAGAKQSNSEAVAAFRALVAKLPRSNRLILNAICRLCQKIAAKRDANLMGTQALAIVIAPTILLPIDEASLLATNNARLNAFERLLLLYPDVFGEVATEEAAAKKEVAVFVEWKARQKRDRLEELRRSHHERQKTASLGMSAVSALEWMKKRRQELESQQQEKDEEVERAKASEREAELARQAREFEERMRKEKEEQEAIARKHREEEEEMRRAESDAKSKYEAAMLENQRRIEAERKRREEAAAAAAAAAAAKAAAEEAATKAKEEETEEEEEEEDEDLPICAACNKPIRDDEDGLAALGKEWHETCFVCTECKGPLGKTIKQKDGKPFCGACFERLFLPKCASCGKAIAGAVVKALDQPWHPECFVCSRCGNPIAGGFSSGPDGKPVCSACNQ